MTEPRRAREGLAANVRAIAGAAAVVLSLGLPAPGALAQSNLEFGLTGPVEQSLQRIQEGWLQWMSAFYQNHPERSAAVVEDLVGLTEQLGLERLPDLARGAAVRAVEAARTEDFERARWALDAADRLDDESPEAAFARSTVERLAGNYVGFLTGQLRGYGRLARSSLGRRLQLFDLALWALASLLVAGALFIALTLAVHGKRWITDLTASLAGRLPEPLAVPVALVALIWPLMLPGGLVWLFLYWSVLLWDYGSRSERAVLVLLWLAAGAAPFLVDESRRQVDLALEPAVLAMESLAEGRLYGDLFRDLEQLPALLPEEPAVAQLLADVHRELGQWDSARTLYRRVLDDEPDNTWALVDLGAYHFHQQDFGSAVQFFQQAAAADPTNVAAHYNLSRAYSESYLFDESQRALQEAQRIDDLTVSRYLEAASQRRVITYSGGLARRAEIRRRMGAELGLEEGITGRLLDTGRSLAAVLLLFGAAAALHFLRRRRGVDRALAPAGPVEGRGSLLRLLVPGLSSLERGRGARALAALWIPVSLFLLPVHHGFYPLPLAYDPGDQILWGVAVAGLIGYLGVRLRMSWSGRPLRAG